MAVRESATLLAKALADSTAGQKTICNPQQTAIMCNPSDVPGSKTRLKPGRVTPVPGRERSAAKSVRTRERQSMLRYAAVTGWGHYVPEKVLTNQELQSLVATSDEWIRKRTGITERRIAGAGETTSSMCTTAALRALACADLASTALDLVICATTTPDHLLPPTGCLVQRQLGADHAGAFDVNAACTGFLYGLAVGSQFIQAGTCDRILVVGGETLSRFVNWKDRNTCILFGD